MTIDKICIWYKGSTNPITKENEKPQSCKPECKGYDINCKNYLPKSEEQK